MQEDYWNDQVEGSGILNEGNDLLKKEKTPLWKKSLLFLILAPKGGILLSPFLIKKFMANSAFTFALP
jgi:hypothetical protein